MHTQESLILILIVGIATFLICGYILFILKRYYKIFRLDWKYGIYFRHIIKRRPFWKRDIDIILELEGIIDDAEEQAGIFLTWGAREMLIIPIIEKIKLYDSHIDLIEIKKSITDIVNTIKEYDGGKYFHSKRKRDSISVIWGFHKRFCNIPPFCSRIKG